MNRANYVLGSGVNRTIPVRPILGLLNIPISHPEMGETKMPLRNPARTIAAIASEANRSPFANQITAQVSSKTASEGSLTRADARLRRRRPPC
jgi:hypothetical protein